MLENNRPTPLECGWLIEADLLDSTELLVDALKRQEIPYKKFKYNYSQPYDFLDLFPVSAPTIFYGSLNTAKYLQKNSAIYPGAYYNQQEYNCTNYYSKLGEYLLNSEYIMLPFAELCRRKEFLFDILGEDRAVFIRPNRGDKIFTGKVVFKENFEKEVERFSFNNFHFSEIVVVARPQNILYEWRFVVADGHIISGSQYKKGNSFIEDTSYPPAAAELAEEISNAYKPDPVYIVDICQTANGVYRLMEIGSFSCAGLYKCDADAVVREVSKIVLEDWKDNNG